MPRIIVSFEFWVSKLALDFNHCLCTHARSNTTHILNSPVSPTNLAGKPMTTDFEAVKAFLGLKRDGSDPQTFAVGDYTGLLVEFDAAIKVHPAQSAKTWVAGLGTLDPQNLTTKIPPLPHRCPNDLKSNASVQRYKTDFPAMGNVYLMLDFVLSACAAIEAWGGSYFDHLPAILLTVCNLQMSSYYVQMFNCSPIVPNVYLLSPCCHILWFFVQVMVT
jgi:hypothetical protein